MGRAVEDSATSACLWGRHRAAAPGDSEAVHREGGGEGHLWCLLNDDRKGGK